LHVNNFCHWFEQFKEAGGVCKRESSGRLAVKEENVERMWRASFAASQSQFFGVA